MRRLRHNFLLILMLLVLVITITITITASAQPLILKQNPVKTSGNKFIDLCTAPNENARDSCGGVVTSLLNVQIEMARIDPDHKYICPQRVLTVEEGRRIFLYWVEVTPEALTMGFPELVMQALHSRYPCNQPALTAPSSY